MPRSYSELKQQIVQLNQHLMSARLRQGTLLREGRAWARKITKAKERLQQRPNPVGQRQLQQDLKKSRSLADQLSLLDRQIHQSTQKSVALKKQLIQVLETDIAARLKESESEPISAKKRKLLEQVLVLQKEKDDYQAQITQESRELLLGLVVQLKDTDGPAEIQQKLAIVRDQRDLLRTKIERIDKQSEDARKKLHLLQNMLELLRDMRRAEDDEFDLDRGLRIAELEGEITDTEAWLETAQARREDWSSKIAVFTDKVERFFLEIERLTSPQPKGDAGDKQ